MGAALSRKNLSLRTCGRTEATVAAALSRHSMATMGSCCTLEAGNGIENADPPFCWNGPFDEGRENRFAGAGRTACPLSRGPECGAEFGAECPHTRLQTLSSCRDAFHCTAPRGSEMRSSCGARDENSPPRRRASPVYIVDVCPLPIPSIRAGNITTSRFTLCFVRPRTRTRT